MRGFSGRNIWDMRRFFETYSSESFLRQVVAEFSVEQRKGKLEGTLSASVATADSAAFPILRQLVAEIPWGHHLLILNALTEPAPRLYYLKATAQFGWSRAVLLNQIKAQAYERAKAEKKTHNFAAALPEHFAEQADEMLKSRYNLEFLGIARPMKERELEERLIGRLQQFILELGYGFCFVGRQYRLALGAKEYFVDLLFYHRFLKALVAFDLHPVR